MLSDMRQYESNDGDELCLIPSLHESNRNVFVDIQTALLASLSKDDISTSTLQSRQNWAPWTRWKDSASSFSKTVDSNSNSESVNGQYNIQTIHSMSWNPQLLSTGCVQKFETTLCAQNEIYQGLTSDIEPKAGSVNLVPFVTISEFSSLAEAPTTRMEVEVGNGAPDAKKLASFQVDSIYVMERSSVNDQFRVVHRIPLSTETIDRDTDDVLKPKYQTHDQFKESAKKNYAPWQKKQLIMTY